MRRLILLALVSALTIAAQPRKTEVVWKPVFAMGDQLFPSYILATSAVPPREIDNPLYLGDPDGLIGVTVANPGAHTTVRLEVQIDRLQATGTFEGVLEERGRQYEIYPKILYRYDLLPLFDQLVPANVTIRLSLNGRSAGQRTSVVRVHSIQDCVNAVRKPDGQVRSMPWMFAAYVNENHPAIDQVLSDALDSKLVNRFVGYINAKGATEVYQQVFAIWDVFLRRGFRYSTIQTTPTSGGETQLSSQTVRLVDDSLRTSQANCLDGSVLFASVLRRVGIDPFLVLIPHHAFVGFYLDQEHRTAGYLETTRMGTVDLDQAALDSTGRTLEGIANERARNTESYRSFVSAVRFGLDEYTHNKNKFLENDIQYRLVDIGRARKQGIIPIARP